MTMRSFSFYCWFWPQMIVLLSIIPLLLCASAAVWLHGEGEDTIQAIAELCLNWLDHIDIEYEFTSDTVNNGQE